jgi:hypothetical protein
MGITRNILPYTFQNIAPGEQDPQKRVDADRIMANYNAITSVIAVVEASGEFAQDGNSNGISTQSQCNLTIYTGDSKIGLLDVGDIVVISDGDNVWQKTTDEQPTTQFNDEISFSDDNLITGEGVDNYSSPDFIEGLLFTIRKPGFADLVMSDRILFGGEKGVSGTAIPRSPASEETVQESLTNLESGLTEEHNEDGSHKDGTFSSNHLKYDGFVEELFANLIDGSFENDANGDGVAEPWSPYNEPDLSLSSEEVYQGDYSQKVIATQSGDGIETTLDDISILKGMKITVNLFAYTTDAGVVIEVDDGISTTQSSAMGSSGEWVSCHLTVDIDQEATEVSIRIYADDADIQYYDACVVSVGRLTKTYSSNTTRVVSDVLEETSPVNLIFGLNSGTNQVEEGLIQPDGWELTEDIPALSQPVDTINPVNGENCWELKLFNNEGVIQHLSEAIVKGLGGVEVCLSLYIRKVSDSIDPLKITLESDQGVVVETDVSMDKLPENDWRRVYISGIPDPTAGALFLKIANMAGTSDFVHCYLDGLMLHKGTKPVACLSGSIYETVVMNFSKSGEITEGYISGSGGIAGDGYPLPFSARLTRLSGYVNTPPGDESREFDIEVRVNGVSSDLKATFRTGENYAEHHSLVEIERQDRISVYADTTPPMGTDAENLYLTLELLKYRW